jgi:hypothetical protein
LGSIGETNPGSRRVILSASPSSWAVIITVRTNGEIIVP